MPRMPNVKRDGFRPGASVRLMRRGDFAGRDAQVGDVVTADSMGRATVDVTGLAGGHYLTDGTAEVSLSLPLAGQREAALYDADDQRLEDREGAALPVESTDLPTITNHKGLRRLRAIGSGLYERIPVVWVGNSITFGQGADGTNDTPADKPSNAARATQADIVSQRGSVGQARTILSKTYGDPGEGIWLPNDPRITASGGSTNGNAGSALRTNRLFSSATPQTHTFTVPTGVTKVGIIYANTATTANAMRWKKDTVDQGATTGTTLDGSGRPKRHDVTVAAGNAIEFREPASGSSIVIGYVMNPHTTGWALHRIGQGGYVISDAIGGATDGVPDRSSSVQQMCIRALYDWATTPGLLILQFTANEQTYQAIPGGAAANGKNGMITLAKYTQFTQQVVDQAVADGWCVLLIGDPPNPNPATGAGIASEAEYHAAAKQIAASTDHCAFIDIRDVWKDAASTQALGQQITGSIHPTVSGYGDIARMVVRTLLRPAPNA